MAKFHIKLPGFEVGIVGAIAVIRVGPFTFERVGQVVGFGAFGRSRAFILPGAKLA